MIGSPAAAAVLDKAFSIEQLADRAGCGKHQVWASLLQIITNLPRSPRRVGFLRVEEKLREPLRCFVGAALPRSAPVLQRVHTFRAVSPDEPVASVPTHTELSGEFGHTVYALFPRCQEPHSFVH